MNITVSAQKRTAFFDSPSVFDLGEAIAISLTGLDSPDLNTLKLGLYTPSGVLIALCESFSTTDNITWTGTLDTRTTNALTLFVSARPDQRVPLVAVMADGSQLWFTSAVEMVNNPFVIPVTPSPSIVYLTSAMFAGIAPLSPDTTMDEMAALMTAILERLQAP